MAKKQKVEKLGIEREYGYLYYINKKGDVWRAPMKNTGVRGGKKMVAKVGLKKEKGYLYFLDKAGDISRTKMQRGG